MVLPNKIIVFKNDDKSWHEKPSEDLACMPHPSRGILISQPNGGKSLCILNMIYHNNFKRIIVVHNDISTQEYKLLDCDIVDEIPHIDEFDKTEKTLLILEDLNYRHMTKEQKHRWNRVYGTWSTHNNISVWSTFQTPFSSPPEYFDVSLDSLNESSFL